MPRSGRLFRADASSRYLPWVLGLMTFLSVVSLAALLTVERSLDRWRQGEAGMLTIQIPPSEDAGADALAARAVERRLRAEPSVASVHLLTAAEVADLLVPWLGEDATAADLPVPRVLDVRLHQSDEATVAALAALARSVAPDAAIDDHRAWRERLLDYAGWLRGGVAFQLVLVLAVTAASAGFLTLARMAIHADAIELLHQMGAGDRFIVEGLVRQSALTASVAAALGFAAAGLLLVAVAGAGAGVDDAFVLVLRLEPWDWLAFAAVPVVTVALTVLVAATTADRRLRRMP